MADDKPCEGNYKEELIELWNIIKEQWQNIKESIRNARLAIAKRNEVKHTWQPMIDNTRKDQVMNRKPMVSHIRNTI